MKLWQNVKFPKAGAFQAFPTEHQCSGRNRVLYHFPSHPCSVGSAPQSCFKATLERWGNKWQVRVIVHEAHGRPLCCLLYTLEQTWTENQSRLRGSAGSSVTPKSKLQPSHKALLSPLTVLCTKLRSIHTMIPVCCSVLLSFLESAPNI